MKFKLLKGAFVGLIFSVSCLFNMANAGLITSISGLNIGGTTYDVTLHNSTVTSWLDLWDVNDNGIFGDDASVFATPPTFWGSLGAAASAAFAIITALDDTDWTGGNAGNSDRVYVAYGIASNGNLLTVGDANISLDTDTLATLAVSRSAKDNSSVVFASFELSGITTVPEPSTLAILALGMIGLASRRFKKQA